ncbi:hypothetical protein B353_21177 [Bacillus anthracis str. UR-1]|nr:hypothetical protein B353_21177 [Bacillus anthracis str. UR-1]
MNKLRILKQYLKTKYGLRFSNRKQLEQFHKRQIEKQLLFTIERRLFIASYISRFYMKLKKGICLHSPLLIKK